MSFATRARRWSARGGLAAIVLLAGATAQTAATAAPAAAAPTAVAAGAPPVSNPYAPAYHHPYRHGAVPTLGAAARMAAWASRNPRAASASPAFSPAVTRGAGAASANNVTYGGGSPDGIGVTIGDEKVYLVFYGSQWGKRTIRNGIMTFSHDPSGEARYVQELFRGLGTGNEEWSGIATQYCQGPDLTSAQTCPSTDPHVAYPHGGALAGVWYDRAKSPAQATGHRLALQAVAAATHFHNMTTGANRNAAYIILSPTGADPDRYKQQGFCAWHDFTGDTALTGGAVTPPAGYGQLAFANMPYVTDLGAACGAHFVRSGKAGKLDGVSIVVGHEYAETITDQEPPTGWTDTSGNEVADKCAWKQTGAGKVGLLHLPTGTFAMQGIWANNSNGGRGGCRFTESIKSTQLLQNPGFETGTLSPGWTGSAVLDNDPSSAHSGAWLAVLDGGTAPQTSTLAQTVRVAPPVGRYGAATFSFWLEITTNHPTGKVRDTLKVQELTAGGKVLRTLATLSNLNAAGHAGKYVQHAFTLSPSSWHGQPGQRITLKFTGKTRAGDTTGFFIDDAALNAS
jgi:serine protease